MAASARPPAAGGAPASRGCRPGPSRPPRRSRGCREGGGRATPRRDRPGRGSTPASGRPRRGGGGAANRPHLSAARPGTPAKRRPGTEGPRPSLRHSPCLSPRRGSSGLALPSAIATPPSRSPHSLFTAPDRLLKSGQTAVRPLAVAALASRVPTAPRSLIGWRGAPFPRLLLIGSRAHPSRENRSPSSLLQPPTPKMVPHQEGRRNGQWVSGERPGGGRLDGVVGDEAQPMGARRTSRPSSAAPRSPASRRVAPRATPDCPGAAAQPTRKVRAKWRAREPAQQPLRRAWVRQRGPWRTPDGGDYPRPKPSVRSLLENCQLVPQNAEPSLCEPPEGPIGRISARAGRGGSRPPTRLSVCLVLPAPKQPGARCRDSDRSFSLGG